MSEINNFSDYASKYNTNMDYSYLFGGSTPTQSNGTISLGDYASIKNGSYGKLLKSYYAKQDADKLSKTGDNNQTSMLIRSGADSLKKSAEALNDDSLWEKKKIKKKDEKTGVETETEDYDWEAITKAVKTFVDDYNSVVEETGKSETKAVLRNAVWMTGATKKMGHLLGKAGITIGKGNKLELDEKELKEADISTLKTLFTGHGSLADKITQKAGNISREAAGSRNTYTRSGSYANAISDLVSGMVDKEV